MRSFQGSNVHCGSCSHERIQYGVIFPQSGKLKNYGSNADICSDVARPSSSGLGNLFELSDRSHETIMAVMLTYVLMWLGHGVAARAICLSFQIGQMKLLFYYFPHY